MYSIKFPTELIKKKVYEHTIAYKFKWSNGTISIEPMNQLTPQMLELVHEYEMQQYHQIHKKVKLNSHQISPKSSNNCLPNSFTDFQQSSLIKKQQPSRLTNKAPVKAPQKILPQDIIQQKEESNSKLYLKKTFTKHSHLPRPNKYCVIKNIRRENGDIYLQITDDQTKWIKLEDLKKDSPITLCDYLLSKIRFK
ncbi:unnamed protein product (macronuclear) [Paramecium tetraurelia]|uniref:Chromo domain-containing protein n=1 Tax=Paramecium tetraurelia TaxID=5888 RepID=A0E034_PARTE|nr:uncharacterized protein GSPATT00021819001 [Paramecium tetraurelia]CAK88651.1 unnamed protein product [Paramecium tetraurelia]|eukprot:XP_001456048.1 hypothetical protein (macronuclear) [Paramecium tetraurelia strain d4-2]